MNSIYKKVCNEIKKYNNIYVVRHIGPDPDCIASQIALRDSIKLTFPNKNVYALGGGLARFKYFGKLDKADSIDYENSLLIAVDVPDKRRIDASNIESFKNIIKIDHHIFVEDFGGLELINYESTSASEIIYILLKETKLKMDKHIAENLFIGIMSDSNRLMFEPSSYKQFSLVSELIHTYNLNIQELYGKLYAKPLSEVRLMGYIASNLKVTKNKFAFINLENDIIKSLGADASSASNMINDFNNIDEILVWMFVTKDEKNDMFRINIRSRGPAINKIANKYSGGGHRLASGVRTKDKEVVESLENDLDELCKMYMENNKTN